MKAILIIWIGFGQAQTMSMTHFDTIGECRAAQKALAKKHRKLEGDCVPYTFESAATVSQ